MSGQNEWVEFVCEDCGSEVALLMPQVDCALEGRCSPCKFLATLEPDERKHAEPMLFPEGRIPILKTL